MSERATERETDGWTYEGLAKRLTLMSKHGDHLTVGERNACYAAARRLRQPEPAREGEGEPDHDRQILAFFLEAREYYQDIYDWDDERAAEGFVDWVRETVQGFLDGKYDGGPHDPRRSEATAHQGGSE